MAQKMLDDRGEIFISINGTKSLGIQVFGRFQVLPRCPGVTREAKGTLAYFRCQGWARSLVH